MVIKRDGINLSLLIVVSFLACAPVQASEVTGDLSTGIGGTTGSTLEAVVVVPASGGGGGGGGSSSSSSSSKSTQVIVTPSIVPVAQSVAVPGKVLGASTYNFTTYLGIGATGQAVTALQNILANKGYLPVTSVTGYFGPMTKAALMKYQSAQGIPSVGYVGPTTRSYLNKETNIASAEPTIAELMAKVQVLQALLVALQKTNK